MNDAATKPFNETLCFEQEMPFEWRPEPDTGDGSAVQRLHEDNVQTLQAVGVLEEYHKDLEGEGNTVARDLARIEFKLNLLMGLVGKLATRELKPPPKTRVRLYGAGIEWLAGPDSDVPADGARCQISVYLHPAYPRALSMTGTVAYLKPEEGGTAVGVEFTDVTTVVEDEVERLIFRHHRRALAEARKPR